MIKVNHIHNGVLIILFIRKREHAMEKALVVIDIQNDITKNYKEIIDNINKSIDWAVKIIFMLFT